MVGGGGILVIGGCLFTGFAVAYRVSGHAVGLGSQGLGGFLVVAALALLGAGSALLSLARPSLVRGRAVRSSLAIFAAGVLALAASAIASYSSESDSLESLPIVVLTLGGGLVMLIGVAALAITVPTALSRRRPGQAPR